MTEEQFAHFRLHGSETYARTSSHFSEMSSEDALQVVLKDFDTRLAPKGLQTPGHFFLSILLNDVQIGYFHFNEFPKGTKSLYGWNFHIFTEYQKKGHAKAAMELARSYFKERGYSKIALNVVSSNATAIHLYEKFGFQITQINMERTL